MDTTSRTRVGFSCEWMSLTIVPVPATGVCRANKLDAFRKSLRLSATCPSRITKTGATFIEQPYPAHLYDVHKIVVVEMPMKTETALLHGSRRDRDEYARRDVRTVAADTMGSLRGYKQQQNCERGAVVVDDVAELVVAEHPTGVNDELHHGSSNKPLPVLAGERRRDRRDQQQEACDAHADRRDLPQHGGGTRIEGVLEAVISATDVAPDRGGYQCQGPPPDRRLSQGHV